MASDSVSSSTRTTTTAVTTTSKTKLMTMTNQGRKVGEKGVPKMGQVLALVDQGRKYSKVILFLAIVDILMAIIVLGSWIIMISILFLIFTADRDRCQRDDDQEEDHQIDRAHLETSTIILYIIQPIFYTMSLLTAMLMAHNIQKVDRDVLTVKRKCLWWILTSFLHCLELEFIIFLVIVKYEAALAPLIFFSLTLLLMIWEILVMVRDYLSYVHFGHYLSALLDTPLTPDTIASALLLFSRNGGIRKRRKYFETRVLVWTVQVLMNGIQVFVFLLILRLLRHSPHPSDMERSRRRGQSGSKGESMTMVMFLIFLFSLILRVIPSSRILRLGHHDDHFPVHHLMTSVVDTFFQFLTILLLINLKKKKRHVDLADDDSEESQV